MRIGQKNVLTITETPSLWGQLKFDREAIMVCLQEDLIEPTGTLNENEWGYQLTDKGRKALS